MELTGGFGEKHLPRPAGAKPISLVPPSVVMRVGCAVSNVEPIAIAPFFACRTALLARCALVHQGLLAHFATAWQPWGHANN